MELSEQRKNYLLRIKIIANTSSFKTKKKENK